MTSDDDVIRHVRADIRALGGYTPGEQQPGFIKLNTNECPWGPAPGVRAALAAIADDSLRLYPDPVSTRLRQVAAARFAVAADGIVAGNGSDDCLTIVYRTFIGPGDGVATPWPSYGLYDTLAALQGAPIVHVPFGRAASAWQLPVDALATAAAKLTLVANPNNPSSTLVPVSGLRRLADRLAPHGVLVVDEAYVDFALPSAPDASMLPHLGAHPNVIVLRTFSKSYSLAGARLGLAFAAPALVREMAKVKDSYNVNVITQALGAAALEDRVFFDDTIGRTLAERARLEAALGALGWTWPAPGGNFLFCDVGPGARAGDIYRALKARHILVRWWDTPELGTCLRITVGRPDQNNALVAALRDIVG